MRVAASPTVRPTMRRWPTHLLLHRAAGALHVWVASIHLSQSLRKAIHLKFKVGPAEAACNRGIGRVQALAVAGSGEECGAEVASNGRAVRTPATAGAHCTGAPVQCCCCCSGALTRHAHAAPRPRWPCQAPHLPPCAPSTAPAARTAAAPPAAAKGRAGVSGLEICPVGGMVGPQDQPAVTQAQQLRDHCCRYSTAR